MDFILDEVPTLATSTTTTSAFIEAGTLSSTISQRSSLEIQNDLSKSPATTNTASSQPPPLLMLKPMSVLLEGDNNQTTVKSTKENIDRGKLTVKKVI